MKVLKYVHGESTFTVYLEPTVDNLKILDKYFLEENGHEVLQDIEGYEKNIGLFSVIPLTGDWGIVYIAEYWIILSLNKLHPKFEEIKKKLFSHSRL
jgi:hypothetical protein